MPNKSCSEIHGSSSWYYNSNVTNDRACASSARVTQTILDGNVVQLTCKDPTIGGQSAVITATQQCPLNYSCPNCSTTNPTSGYLPPFVCVCDESTGYNPECVPQQYNGKPLPANLCSNNAQPEQLTCHNSGGTLYHCPGFVPDINDPSYATYSQHLKDCISSNLHIDYNKIWYETPFGTNNVMPIYPAIDNQQCVMNFTAGNAAVSDVSDYGGAAYYSLWPNPVANVMADGTLHYRKDGPPSGNLFVNAYRKSDGSPAILGPLSSVINETQQTNVGCYFNNSTNAGFTCSGRGTFTQTCYKKDGTSISCTDPSAYYFMNEGTCSCNTGYAGHYCEITSPICKHGTLSSDKTSCECPFAYTGNDCSISQCIHGKPSDTGDSCICDQPLVPPSKSRDASYRYSKYCGIVTI